MFHYIMHFYLSAFRMLFTPFLVLGLYFFVMNYLTDNGDEVGKKTKDTKVPLSL
ncbi:hypothetical protein FQN60_006181 [Etheostoma spectabile]|uniref:Uncharacterized protein n=1 Tax=Etheostoma spectabile TaxID=54343 RepID=A0A5J5CQ69_9PERO|nr:hypothetical protein FQN60_006181 [Etheostoma spectabile]